MLFKILKFIARLRSQQPALSLLPGIIISQSFSEQIGLKASLVLIVALVYGLVKAKNFLGLFAGLAVGLISTISWQAVEKSASVHSIKVVGVIEHQGLRFPKPGLVQFNFLALRQYALNQAAPVGVERRKFQCRAVNLPWKNIAAMRGGDLVLLDAKFVLFPKNLWPWDFDAQLLRRGFAGTCKVSYSAILGQGKISWLGRLRLSILERYRLVVGDDELAALLLSLSLGVRDLISSGLERDFKDLGISHVLVLSGMQIGLLFFSVACVVRKILRRSSSFSPSLIIPLSYYSAALISLLLVDLTFYEASALRAWIACVLVALADSFERRSDLVRGTLASFVVLSLLWPGCWAEAGVQLSFAALLGIAIGQDLAVSKKEKILLPCFFATCLTAVVSAVWFESLSLSSLVANFLLAPWFGVLGCYLGFVLILACYFCLPYVDELSMLIRCLMSVCLQIVESVHAFMPGPLILQPIQCLGLLILLVLSLLWYFKRRAFRWVREFNLFRGAI